MATVTFGRPNWISERAGTIPGAPADVVNAREVRVNGDRRGVLYGHNAPTYNPNRPRSFQFRPADGGPVIEFSHMEGARTHLARLAECGQL